MHNIEIKLHYIPIRIGSEQQTEKGIFCRITTNFTFLYTNKKFLVIAIDFCTLNPFKCQILPT